MIFRNTPILLDRARDMRYHTRKIKDDFSMAIEKYSGFAPLAPSQAFRFGIGAVWNFAWRMVRGLLPVAFGQLGRIFARPERPSYLAGGGLLGGMGTGGSVTHLSSGRRIGNGGDGEFPAGPIALVGEGRTHRSPSMASLGIKDNRASLVKTTETSTNDYIFSTNRGLYPIKIVSDKINGKFSSHFTKSLIKNSENKATRINTAVDPILEKVLEFTDMFEDKNFRLSDQQLELLSEIQLLYKNFIACHSNSEIKVFNTLLNLHIVLTQPTLAPLLESFNLFDLARTPNFLLALNEQKGSMLSLLTLDAFDLNEANLCKKFVPMGVMRGRPHMGDIRFMLKNKNSEKLIDLPLDITFAKDQETLIEKTLKGKIRKIGQQYKTRKINHPELDDYSFVHQPRHIVAVNLNSTSKNLEPQLGIYVVSPDGTKHEEIKAPEYMEYIEREHAKFFQLPKDVLHANANGILQTKLGDTVYNLDELESNLIFCRELFSTFIKF